MYIDKHKCEIKIGIKFITVPSSVSLANIFASQSTSSAKMIGQKQTGHKNAVLMERESK